MKQKRKKAISDFLSFIFNEKVFITEDVDGVYDVEFFSGVAKRDAIVNLVDIKKVLNIYLTYHNINNIHFKLNIKKNDEENED